MHARPMPEEHLFDFSLEMENWNPDARQHMYQLENEETEKERNSYEEVLMLMDTVKQGDLEKFYHIFDESLLDRIGTMASTPLKQMEYTSLIAMSNVKQAAANGGLTYREASDLYDIYAQRLSVCNTIADMRVTLTEYIRTTVKQVHNIRQRNTEYDVTAAAMEYIMYHRSKKFQISEMAREIGVHPAYLSRKFREKNGMTIQQYIAKERIGAACNLLKYSDYNISLIANYLCFSSQSHFSSTFRKIQGMTPEEYRRKWQFLPENTP